MIRPPLLHVLQGRLGRDEDAADVDVDDAVESPRSWSPRTDWNGGAGVVDEDVEPAERGDGLLDRVLRGLGVGGVGLDGHRFAARVSIASTTDAAASAPLE